MWDKIIRIDSVLDEIIISGDVSRKYKVGKTVKVIEAGCSNGRHKVVLSGYVIGNTSVIVATNLLESSENIGRISLYIRPLPSRVRRRDERGRYKKIITHREARRRIELDKRRTRRI